MHFFSKLILVVLVILPSTLAAVNGKCSGRNGICISTGNCKKYGGTYYSGKCPNDPNDIKCCDSIPCKANDGRSGNCKFTNQCGSNYETISNKCPGGSDFKCCVQKKAVNPPPATSGKKPKYFTIEELTRSSTATARGINNTPSAEIKKKLESLIVNCLDPIREIYGKPINVSSGYRCEALNKAVGGATNSQHKKGEAADLVPAAGGNLRDIYKAIIKFGNYDQFIIEKSGGSQWAHVSYTSNPRRQILYYNGSSYKDVTNNYQSYI